MPSSGWFTAGVWSWPPGSSGLTEVPAVCLKDLSEAELRILRLALNRISQDAAWDPKEFALELEEILIQAPQSDLELTGFEPGEIDFALDGCGADEEDEVPQVEPGGAPVTQLGDQWDCGGHKVFCGNALEKEAYERLLGIEKARLVVTDPPYNLESAHISGRGKVKHPDFAMASGELSPAEFQTFLATAFAHMVASSVDGALHFIFIDWRHLRELMAAADPLYRTMLNLCVWRKSNGGMGSLYRSQHELVLVYKSGSGPHINNVALGRYGRNRTNVWDYVGQSALNATSKSKTSLHPTVKPVGMIADIIRDCSNRGDMVLDPFGGAGTTLIAAERAGRHARLIELDPVYVDVTIERWQRLAGGTARHAVTGEAFPRRGRTST